MNTQVRRVIGLQLAVTLIVALLLLVLVAPKAALAGALGGMIGVLSSVVYGWMAYRKQYWAPERIFKAHFAAEMLKIGSVTILFALAMIFLRELPVLYLFGGYISSLTVYWFALLFKN